MSAIATLVTESSQLAIYHKATFAIVTADPESHFSADAHNQTFSPLIITVSVLLPR